MASRFRHEDVSSVPKGWKVRTVTHDNHRVRVAFPPGRKQTGSGRLVSILHPVSGSNPCTNPCTLRSSNPAELLIMGANPPRTRNNLTFRVVAVAKMHGADVVRDFETKQEAKAFTRQISTKEYFRPHIKSIRTNPGYVHSPNPRVEVVHGENPPVEDIVEEFSGTEAEFIDVYNEPHMPRGRYAQLGELLNLYIKPAKGGQVQKITFGTGKDAPVVVTDSTARQIYFVSGNQDITGALEAFGARDRGDGVLVLGEGRRIDYKAKKEHVAEPDEDKWKHDHGEENGTLPTVLFDSRNKKLLYEGGDYRIDGAWIRN
jgi:hypothetical protein